MSGHAVPACSSAGSAETRPAFSSAVPAETGPFAAPHRVRLDTFGCRVNKYDSSVLRAELLSRGYEVSEDEGSFDTLILNTCTVTEATDQATRRLIRRLRRQHPDAPMVLTGCYAELAGDSLQESLGVQLVVGQQQRASLVDRLDHLLGHPAPQIPVIVDKIPERGRHTRFFFKVQDGCDVRCSFCIIPDARGHSRSLPIAEVVETVQQAVARGYQEVILSGIHLGAYGRDRAGESGLGRLVRRVLAETEVRRLRLGSLEPWGVRPDLIQLLADEPRLLPSLHLPLQSGSERILQAMRRPISARRYHKLVEDILQARPDLTLWLDVIAGFPGETDAEHGESLAFVEALPFTRLHVFPYSLRHGTPAAALPQHVPEDVKQARVLAFLSLSEARFLQRLQARVGSTDEILLEQGGRGHTRDNLPIQLEDGLGQPLVLDGQRGEPLAVRLVGVAGERLRAQPLESEAQSPSSWEV